MRQLVPLLVLTVGLTLGACGDHGHSHDADGGHGHHGPNGGHLVELGTVGHLEFVNDAKTGTAKVWITGPDAETPLRLERSPVLKLTTPDGPVAIGMNPIADGVSDTFTVTHAALKNDHPEGRISLEIGGQTYNPTLEDSHHH